MSEKLAAPEQRSGPEHDRKMQRIRRVERSITHLESLDLGYVLGGARQYHPQLILPPGPQGSGWTDCSGFGCYECAVAGINLANPAGWTGTLAQEGSEGLSEYLTLFLKEVDSTEGHLILRLRHHPHFRSLEGAAQWRWAECGGSDNPHPGGGPTWFKPTDERIDEFPFKRHFKVLS